MRELTDGEKDLLHEQYQEGLATLEAERACRVRAAAKRIGEALVHEGYATGGLLMDGDGNAVLGFAEPNTRKGGPWAGYIRVYLNGV